VVNRFIRDGEEFRKIEGHPKYWISDRGRVLSHMKDYEIFLKTKLRGGNSRTRPKGRYPSVGIQGKSYNIHALVAKHFIGPRPEGMVCCHNDGDCLNNHVSNLRYDTQKNNNLDRIKHGTARKLTNEMLDDMFQMLATTGCEVKAVANWFGVPRTWTSQARVRAKNGLYKLPKSCNKDYRTT